MYPIESQPNANVITLREDFIDIVWDGAQDTTKVRQSNLDTLAAAEALLAAGKPLYLSMYIQHHPRLPNLGAFREVLKIFRALSFERVVISGKVSPRIMSLILTIVSSFNKELDIVYIADREKALAWLLNHSSK